MNKTITIFEKKTRAKTIARRPAQDADLNARGNSFLVPVNGGHATAKFDADRYWFLVSGYGRVYFPTLENVYLL